MEPQSFVITDHVLKRLPERCELQKEPEEFLRELLEKAKPAKHPKSARQTLAHGSRARYLVSKAPTGKFWGIVLDGEAKTVITAYPFDSKRWPTIEELKRRQRPRHERRRPIPWRQILSA